MWFRKPKKPEGEDSNNYYYGRCEWVASSLGGIIEGEDISYGEKGINSMETKVKI